MGLERIEDRLERMERERRNTDRLLMGSIGCRPCSDGLGGSDMMVETLKEDRRPVAEAVGSSRPEAVAGSSIPEGAADRRNVALETRHSGPLVEEHSRLQEVAPP